MFHDFMLPDTPAVLFWIFVAVGILIQGISKSGFAGGAGVLAIPLMLLVMPVDKVMSSLLILLLLMDFNAIYHHWHNKDWKIVMEIFLPSVLGILLGAALWWRIGQKGIDQYNVPLKRFVGVISLLFAFYIFAKEWAMDWVARIRPSPAAGAAAGFSAGFISMLTHAAGPIVSLYIYSHGLTKTLFVGTVAWTFMLINLVKLPFFFAVGMIGRRVLLFDLSLVWLVPIGSYLGKWMHDRVSETLFNRVICVLIFLAGIQLILNVDIIHAALRMVF